MIAGHLGKNFRIAKYQSKVMTNRRNGNGDAQFYNMNVDIRIVAPIFGFILE